MAGGTGGKRSMDEILRDREERRKTNRGRNAAEKRWGQINVGTVEERIEEVQAVLDKMRSIPVALRAFGMTGDFKIDGATKYEHGIEALRDWVRNVETGFVRGKHDEY